MAQVPTCPLCGLRYQTDTELQVHVRDDHPHEPPEIRREAIPVVRPGTSSQEGGSTR